MSAYTESVIRLRSKLEQKKDLEKKMTELQAKYDSDYEKFYCQLEALEYIGAVSEKNTNKILDFITGVINNSLSKIFPYDKRYIKLERSLYRDAYTHINLKLITEDGKERDLGTQSGAGLRQIISFLFTLTLIEVRKERRLLVMDELLSGLHSSAKKVIADIMTLFAQKGFQFIAVEYQLNDVGKIYLVEKLGKEAKCSEYQGDYTDDVIFTEQTMEENNIDDEKYKASEKI